MATPLSDLEYTALALWAHQPSKYTYNTKGLATVIEAFMANIERIRTLALMPAVVTAHALQVDNYAKGLPAKPEHFADGAKAVQLYTASVPAVRHGIQTLYSSVVTAAWTAFETLATDLWVEAVNERPTSLGVRALKAQRRRKESGSEEPTQDAKSKAHGISVDRLAKYGFDLKEQLGYFLWCERHFNFNSLETIRHAYQAAFEKDADGWFANPMFADLSTLEAVRHLVVHRGCIVDDSFMARVKNHAQLSTLKLKDKLDFDGKTASHSAELAMVCGLTLMDHVDNWLEASVA